MFQQNLLTLISVLQQQLPQTAVRDLLVCLSREPPRSPWVSALIRQLERTAGVRREQPLCTPVCSQRLEQLSRQFVGAGGARGWADCFDGVVKDSGPVSHSSEQETKKKRKSSQISLDSDGEETEPQSKRPKVDTCSNECIDAPEQSMKEELSEKLERIVPAEGNDEKLQPAAGCEGGYNALPQHIKVTTNGLFVLSPMKFHSFCLNIHYLCCLFHRKPKIGQSHN